MNNETEQVQVPVAGNDKGVAYLDEASNNYVLLQQHQDNIARLKRLTNISMILALAVLVLGIFLIVLIVMFANTPKNRIVNTMDNTAICEVLPENNPYYTPQSITAFAQEAVVALHSFNYRNSDEQLKYVLESYFTKEGRASISQTLAQNNLVNDVVSAAKILEAHATSAPILLESNDKYWIVQFDMQISLYGGSHQQEQSYNRTVKVTVVPTLRSSMNARGLGVSKVEM